MTYKETTIELWRKVWREGVRDLLSTPALEALKTALAEDDQRLAQGMTLAPLPVRLHEDHPVESACPLAYCGVVDLGGFGEARVGEVGVAFAGFCYESGKKLGDPASIRHLLCFWDETPRDEAITLLLAEVRLALADRSDKMEPSILSA
jgi:hypothetical protein